MSTAFVWGCVIVACWITASAVVVGLFALIAHALKSSPLLASRPGSGEARTFRDAVRATNFQTDR
jgi:hypothetical protein